MWFIVKLVAIVLVVALAAQQASMYYNIVVVGSYMSVAPIHLQIITGGLWPIVILLATVFSIRFIVKFKPSDLEN